MLTVPACQLHLTPLVCLVFKQPSCQPSLAYLSVIQASSSLCFGFSMAYLSDPRIVLSCRRREGGGHQTISKIITSLRCYCPLQPRPLTIPFSPLHRTAREPNSHPGSGCSKTPMVLRSLTASRHPLQTPAPNGKRAKFSQPGSGLSKSATTSHSSPQSNPSPRAPRSTTSDVPQEVCPSALYHQLNVSPKGCTVPS